MPLTPPAEIDFFATSAQFALAITYSGNIHSANTPLSISPAVLLRVGQQGWAANITVIRLLLKLAGAHHEGQLVEELLKIAFCVISFPPTIDSPPYRRTQVR
jgi:hypothetical protein